mmetsp:Transcript_67003/g.159851  ORF Transcript_67003/g.159851 Transcript_67003/m.159851 type:complete len:261 (-) Transcript_67003:360-1142(-)
MRPKPFPAKGSGEGVRSRGSHSVLRVRLGVSAEEKGKTIWHNLWNEISPPDLLRPWRERNRSPTSAWYPKARRSAKTSFTFTACLRRRSSKSNASFISVIETLSSGPLLASFSALRAETGFMTAFATRCRIAHARTTAASFRIGVQCCRRASTGGIAVSDSCPASNLRTHAWFRHSVQSSLLLVSRVSILVSRSLASSLIHAHICSGNENSAFLMDANLRSTVDWLKGGTPVSVMYRITPALHMSHSIPYPRRFRTSGAT